MDDHGFDTQDGVLDATGGAVFPIGLNAGIPDFTEDYVRWTSTLRHIELVAYGVGHDHSLEDLFVC
jgi:hypothetical protein